MSNHSSSLPERNRTHPARRQSLLLTILSLLSLTTVVCQFTPGATPAGKGEINVEVRLKTLDEVNTFFNSLPGEDRAADSETLLQYLAGRPEFEATGIAPDGSVWSRFTDGRLLIFPEIVPSSPEEADSAGIEPVTSQPLPTTQTGDGAGELVQVADRTTLRNLASPPERQDWSQQPEASGEAEIPESNTAVTMAYPGINCASSTLIEYLGKKKYTALPLEPTVDNLRDSVKDLAVFYFCTHGGLGKTRYYENDQQTDELVYGLRTTTPVNPENEYKYDELLVHGELVYMAGKSLYGITIIFVRNHMSFSKNSLVVLDGCGTFNYDMKFGFKDAGASVYAGWTDSSQTIKSTLYLFDRLLGVNERRRRTPPNRPFDYVSIWEIMKENYFDIDDFISKGKSYHAVFKFEQLRDSFGILAPSIENMEVDEVNKELTLYGMFGSEQGRVTIDGQEVNVKGEWGADKLVVDLPSAKDPGGKGNVVVTVREHESNKVPLTLWHVQFTYTEGPEQIIGAYQWLYLDIYWRADVHKVREKPDEEPQAQKPVTLEPAEGSKATWECNYSGTYAGITFSTETGKGDLSLVRDETSTGFSSSAELDREALEIQNLEFHVNYDPDKTCVVKSTGPGAEITNSLGFLFLPSLLENVGDTPALAPLELSPTIYWLKGDERDLLHDGSWPWFKWDDTEPEAPPSDISTPS